MNRKSIKPVGKEVSLKDYTNIKKKGDGVWLVEDRLGTNVVIERDGRYFELLDKVCALVHPLDTDDWSCASVLYAVSYDGNYYHVYRVGLGLCDVYVGATNEILIAQFQDIQHLGPNIFKTSDQNLLYFDDVVCRFHDIGYRVMYKKSDIRHQDLFYRGSVSVIYVPSSTCVSILYTAFDNQCASHPYYSDNFIFDCATGRVVGSYSSSQSLDFYLRKK